MKSQEYISFLDRFRIRNRSFKEEESGQVLLLTALIFLVLIAFVAMILPTGQIITAKIQAQNAADAAALAATTWMARGANFLQGINAFRWDVDGIMILAIEGVTYYYLAKVIADIEEFPEGWLELFEDWAEGRENIHLAETVKESIVESIDGSAILLAHATPMIAFSYANQMAKANGADVINPSYLDDLKQNFPLLPDELNTKNFNDNFDKMREWLKTGEFSTGIILWLKERLKNIPYGIGCLFYKMIPDPHGKIPASSFPPYAWPVNPTMNPEEALTFAEEKEVEFSLFPGSPLATEFYWPFSLCLVFIKFVYWNDIYHEDKNIDIPITFMTYKAPAKSFMLNDLLLTASKRAGNKTLVPYTFAFGSARVTGDTLYPAGTADPMYFSCPIFAINLWPFPFVRLFTGGYGGNFTAELTPVSIMNVKGTDCLIYH